MLKGWSVWGCILAAFLTGCSLGQSIPWSASFEGMQADFVRSVELGSWVVGLVEQEPMTRMSVVVLDWAENKILVNHECQNALGRRQFYTCNLMVLHPQPGVSIVYGETILKDAVTARVEFGDGSWIDSPIESGKILVVKHGWIGIPSSIHLYDRTGQVLGSAIGAGGS